MTAFNGGPPSTGRMSTRSTSAPRTRPLIRATANPSQYDPLEPITLEAMNVVSISIPPCAKFTMRVARQIITSESATAAYTTPLLTPLRVRSRKRLIAQKPR